ncbi:hypothetical protein SLS57_002573 [Botryosphaeria dothidea]
MKPGIVIVPAVGLLAGAVMATMTPANLQDTANSLAFQAFDAKDLVLTINSTLNAGPMQDVFEEMDDLYTTVLANIQLVVGSKTLTKDSEDVQLVYEAYSYLVQGMFELMDALGGSATNFVALDKQNEFRVPAAIREVGGVIDAWMFNMISLFPSNSSYADQAANQKNQVDSHFRRSIAAYHLATAKTGTPYGNITNIVSGDALNMDNPTESGDADTPTNSGTSDGVNVATSQSTGTSLTASKPTGVPRDNGNTQGAGANQSDDTPNNVGTSNGSSTDSNPEDCTTVEKVVVTRSQL